MIRLMIVEDQAMLRDSLACTINTQSDMEVVASLGDAAEALRPLNAAARHVRCSMCAPKTTRAVLSRRARSRKHIPR